MANYKPVIPRADSAFDTLQNNLVARASANRVAWGIPEDEITALQAQQAIWAAAWAAAINKNSRTSVQVKAKNLARASYETSLRPFIQRWIVLNSLMNDGQRMSAGISPRIKSRVPVPEPITVPLVEAKLKSGNRVMFCFAQPPGEDGSSRRGKPHGIKFCEIAYKVGSKPSNPQDCGRLMMTRSRHIMQFEVSQRGQTVYFFARWANARGEGGGWTSMRDFIIP